MIKDRVIQVIEYKGIAKEKFYKKIGMTSASFRGNARKTPLNSDAIENILSEIKDLNESWLLTGKGEMLKNKDDFNKYLINESGATYAKKGIALIPIEAMAGWGNGDMQVMEYDASRYVVPEFEAVNADFMIRVKGSSMYPKYASGDIVACKKLPLDTFFQWNKVYVMDTIQGAMIKRIKKCDKKDHVLCVSDNEAYDPFSIALKEIRSLAIVLGVIRLE